MADPARDCPPCPGCRCALGTPIAEDTGVMRWDGPANATLFCPACGRGWVGTEADVAQAWASWRAYEREMRNEDSCPKCCICPHPKDAHGYDYCSAPGCPCKWDLHFHPRAAAETGTEGRRE